MSLEAQESTSTLTPTTAGLKIVDELFIEKKGGNLVSWDTTKVEEAAYKALISVGRTVEEAEDIAFAVGISTETEFYAREVKHLEECNLTISTVLDIHDYVEKALMEHDKDAAKAYIIYRKTHEDISKTKDDLMLTIHEITAEISKDNANVHNSPASKMFEAGQAVYKKYVVTFVLPKDVADAHVNKDFHVHDIAYYPITYNCLAIPLEKMFREGFSTAHGYIRPPRSFMTSCALTAVAIQSCQNDGYGGVSVDMLDSILKTFARTSSDRDIRQGMESMVFNLNTLHSRAGELIARGYGNVAV